jgi:N-formylmaleamate deformylase
VSSWQIENHVTPTTTDLIGRSGYVDGEVRLHHLEYGEPGPTVLIVPGITSPAATWEFISVDLARDYRVVTLDIRGRGLSDQPADGFTLDDYARDVAAVVQALGLERPALVGHSMGARIAAATAVAYPELTGPLVLADPPLTGPDRDPYPMSLAAFMAQLAAANSGAGEEELRRHFPTLSDEHLAVRTRWLGTCEENAVRESWLNFHREDFFPYLRQLEPPVLFMYGEQSPVVPEAALPEVRLAARPGVEFAGISGAGHMIPWDNTADFLAQARRFLAASA